MDKVVADILFWTYWAWFIYHFGADQAENRMRRHCIDQWWPQPPRRKRYWDWEVCVPVGATLVLGGILLHPNPIASAIGMWGAILLVMGGLDKWGPKHMKLDDSDWNTLCLNRMRHRDDFGRYRAGTLPYFDFHDANEFYPPFEAWLITVEDDVAGYTVAGPVITLLGEDKQPVALVRVPGAGPIPPILHAVERHMFAGRAVH